MKHWFAIFVMELGADTVLVELDCTDWQVRSFENLRPQIGSADA